VVAFLAHSGDTNKYNQEVMEFEDLTSVFYLNRLKCHCFHYPTIPPSFSP